MEEQFRNSGICQTVDRGWKIEEKKEKRDGRFVPVCVGNAN
jgi:hypothetical protein